MEVKLIVKTKDKNVLKSKRVADYKKRMLLWDSPVEYVNNMYGCHPNSDKMEYFEEVFKNEEGKS